MATPGVIGETIDIYLMESDGTNPDGEEGVVDAALGSIDSLNNMKPIGSVVIDTTTQDVNITGSGEFKLNSQFGSIVVHDNTADALKTDTGVHRVTITPVPDEIQ